MGIQSLVCSECGAQIQIDDSREFGFCSYCGTKVLLKQIIEVHHTGLSEEERKVDQIEEMKRIKEYVESRSRDYVELGDLRSELATLKPDASLGMFVLGVILTMLGFLGLVSWLKNPGDFPVFTVLFLLCGLALLGFFVHDNNEDVKYKNSLIADINDLNSELREYYEDYGDCPIGMEYFCPTTVDKLYGLMKNGRADSIKEALNIFEDDKHKGRMEHQAMIAAQNTAIAARMATVSAINSMISRR